MSLTAQNMLQALGALDRLLPRKVKLVIGGGGAMLLAHAYPLATEDIDAIPATGMTVQELDPLVKQVAAQLGIAADWLNPYFSTFTHVLPEDYGQRLVPVGSFKNLEALALSKEDLLIMKCFAGRRKDKTHAVALLRAGADVKRVESRLEELARRRIPGADRAVDFLDEARDAL